VDIQEAVTTVLTKKYADFTGRARRSEYWWWALAYFIGSVVISILDRAIGSQILGLIYSLGLLIPGLAVAARRLHDTGKSGWWLLLIIAIFIGWIVLLVFLVQDSTPGDNQYGPNPKGDGGYPGTQGYGQPNPGPSNWG
jgi:uncharacterized membrane protein YhaH (DUF805 family)